MGAKTAEQGKPVARTPFSWDRDPLPEMADDATILLDFHLMRLSLSPTFMAMMEQAPS